MDFKDQSIYRDPRLSNLVNYAIKTECEMYEQAKDQEEYFHLLAERIYKIQKEFEDKQRMSRNNTNNTNANAANTRVNSNDGQLINVQQTQNESGLNTFQTQLNPLNAYNPDLSAGNGGPPNKLAPPSDSMKKNQQMTRTTSQQQLDTFLTNTNQQQQVKHVNQQQQFLTNNTLSTSTLSISETSQMVDSFIKEEATNHNANNAGVAAATVLVDVKPSNVNIDMIKSEALEYNSQLVKTETVNTYLQIFYLSKLWRINFKIKTLSSKIITFIQLLCLF